MGLPQDDTELRIRCRCGKLSPGRLCRTHRSHHSLRSGAEGALGLISRLQRPGARLRFPRARRHVRTGRMDRSYQFTPDGQGLDVVVNGVVLQLSQSLIGASPRRHPVDRVPAAADFSVCPTSRCMLAISNSANSDGSSRRKGMALSLVDATDPAQVLVYSPF